MFTNLRQTGKSIFTRLLMIFLIGMFGLWGIGDVLKNMGKDTGSLATVGKSTITTQDVQMLMRRTHMPAMQAIQVLVAKLLVEKEKDADGIIVGDDEVAQFIRSLPDFHGNDGQFDKALYQRIAESKGENERVFAENIRGEIGKKLLVNPLVSGVQIPEEMVQALYRIQEEQRTANIIWLTPAFAATSVPKPTEAEIKAYYDANPKSFTALEARAISYVELPIADVQAKIEVPDEEVKRTYEERKDDFREPDRRDVGELQFDNEQDAKDAAKALAQGKSFDEIAKSAPLVNKGRTALGMVGRKDLPDEVGDKVIAMKEGANSEPLFAKFRWHIYHVGKTEPGRPQTLEEARPAIVREIASTSASETAQKLINTLEDSMAGGATLEQAAEKIGQKVKAIGPVAQDGKAPGGSEVLESLPHYENFIPVAFATAEKERSQATQTTNGSYFLLRVDSVMPSHVRPFAEVKAQAAESALAAKVSAKLEKMADDISASLLAGKKPEGAPAPVPAGSLKRSTTDVPDGPLKGKTVPKGLVNELFSARPGGSTHAFPTEAGDRMIATLTAIIPAPAKPDPKVMQTLRDDLKSTLRDETVHHYLNYLHNKYPVNVDAAALGALKGEGGSEE